jgi:hypothetical protein
MAISKRKEIRCRLPESLARGSSKGGQGLVIRVNNLWKVVIIVITAVPVAAVENAIGRSLPGVWVQPQAAVVPKEPGFIVTWVPVRYSGSMSVGGSRQQQRAVAPLSGELVFDVSADFTLNVLIPQVVYKTEFSKVGLSSSFYLPLDRRTVNGADPSSGVSSFRSAGLSDVWFSPLTVGVRFSENNNLSIDMKIFAPTAAYKLDDLSNLGMNAWTFQPNVAHTYLWKKRGLEVDNYVGFDIFRQNQLTRYTSGTIFHWDGMLFQYLSTRGGFGAILSNVTQINKDTGPLADQLNGFQGGAWGAGPIVMYVVKTTKPGLIFQFRWVPEFRVTNMLKGNTFLLGLTLQM